MPNNPTIDGVSRQALEQALLAIKRIYQAGHDSIIAAGGSCDSPDYMMAGDPTARELRALLDAPAVDRQDTSVNWQAVATEQMGIIEQRQSTIAQLQARIGELESWQGEPVMKLEAERLWGGAGEYAVSFVKSGWLDECRMTGGEFLLYTAPPAPVAVVLPKYTCIGKGGEYELLGNAVGAGTLKEMSPIPVYRDTTTGQLFVRTPVDFGARMACLDATAALNGERK